MTYLDKYNIKVGLKIKHSNVHDTDATIIDYNKDNHNFTVVWDNKYNYNTKFNAYYLKKEFSLVEELSILEEPCGFCKKMNNIGVSVCWNCAKVISYQ